jgi:hypothetical protein
MPSGVPHEPAPAATPTYRAATQADVETIKGGYVANATVEQIATHLGLNPEEVKAIIAHYSATWVPAAREGRVNPPEEPKTPIASPEQLAAAQSAQTPANGAAAPDQFEAMEKPELTEFCAKNNLKIEIGRRYAKTIREEVRVAWADRQTAIRLGQYDPNAPASVVVPPNAPQVVNVPAPTATTAPAQVVAPASTFGTAPSPSTENPTIVQTLFSKEANTFAPILEEGDDVPSVVTFRLFIDAMPRRTASTVLSVRQAFPECFAQVERDAGVTDYGLIDFGKGPPMVRAAIRSAQTHDPLASDVVILISTRSIEGQHFAELLAELADEVVNGI